MFWSPELKIWSGVYTWSGPATNGSSTGITELLSTTISSLDELNSSLLELNEDDDCSELELRLELDDSFWEELEISLLDVNWVELDELDSITEEDDDLWLELEFADDELLARELELLCEELDLCILLYSLIINPQ